MAEAPSSPGNHAEDCLGLGRRAPEPIGPAAEHDDHDRSAGVKKCVEKLLLASGQRQRGHVAALADRAAPEQAGPIADHRDAQFGCFACSCGCGDPRCVGPVDGHARRMHDRDGGADLLARTASRTVASSRLGGVPGNSVSTWLVKE